MSGRLTNRRVLIVGEGRETEYNYFVGFRNAHQRELQATSTSVAVRRGKGRNAKSIVTDAINQGKLFKPDRKRGDRVFVLLDTEGVGRAPELPEAEILARKGGVEIIYSCPAFEFWLLCHFSRIPRKHFPDCESVVVELEKNWTNVSKDKYNKADLDIFRRTANHINIALEQALEIDLSHLRTMQTAVKTNPSTQMYELIALLIGVQSNRKCPISGTWKLTANTTVTKEVLKGDLMPTHDKATVTWQL